MNEDRIDGNWLQFKGKVKEQWGKLTDDDFDVVAGKPASRPAHLPSKSIKDLYESY